VEQKEESLNNKIAQQGDHSFNFSSLVKTNIGSSITNGTSLWVVIDHFEDDNPLSGLFYSRNSYYNASIDEIPYYETSDKKYYLSDSIDFRINQSAVFSVGNGEYNSPHNIDQTEILSNTKLSNYGNFN
jgi:hypothetical protein